MDGLRAEPFNSDYMLIKAERINANENGDIEIIIGFYFETQNKKGQQIPFIKRPTENKVFKINPYTVCRNTGIKLNNDSTEIYGNFIFEYDLIKYKDKRQNEKYGFIVWDEFYREWRIHSSFEYGASSSVKDVNLIEIISNVLHYKTAIEIIENQDKHINDTKLNDNSYCPSKFKK